MNIIQKTIPDIQYYKKEQPKKIIVLHHTVSGDSVDGDINWWKQTPERVATAYIIDRNGDIYQTFDDKYWAHHLGVTTAHLKKFGSTVTNERLNQLSIGIEIDSWGGLVEKNGKWYTSTNKEIPLDKIEILDKPYRGFKAFEKYTKSQIQSVKELLIHLNKKYGIKIQYNDDMFEFNEKATKGYHGLWSHTSFRPDKSDVAPQKDLISMLKTL